MAASLESASVGMSLSVVQTGTYAGVPLVFSPTINFPFPFTPGDTDNSIDLVGYLSGVADENFVNTSLRAAEIPANLGTTVQWDQIRIIVIRNKSPDQTLAMVQPGLTPITAAPNNPWGGFGSASAGEYIGFIAPNSFFIAAAPLAASAIDLTTNYRISFMYDGFTQPASIPWEIWLYGNVP